VRSWLQSLAGSGAGICRESGDPCSGPSGSHDFRQLPRQPGPGSSLLVLEEDVGLAPRLRQHAGRPIPEVLFPVVLAAQPQITPVRSGRERSGELLVLRHAEGAAAGPQGLEEAVVEPGLVPELEGAAGSRRKRREEVRQARQVLLEVWREL